MNEEQKIEQREVLKKGDGWACYLFAKCIKGADIKRLQEAVLQKGNGWTLYKFAKDIKGADIKRLQEVVLQKGDCWDLYKFAKCVKGADKEKLMARYNEIKQTKQEKEILYSAGVLDGMIKAQKVAKDSSFNLIEKLKFDYIKKINHQTI